MLTHYERMISLYSQNRKRAQKLIKETADAGVNEVWKVVPLAMGHAMDETGRKLQAWKNPNVKDLSALQFEVVRWILEHQEDPYSYSEAMTSPDFHGLMRYFSQTISPASVHTTMQLDYHMASHEKAGKRVYTVSPSLAVQLKHTELRGLRAEDLRLPYESIYIDIPPEAALKVWNEESGWHRAIGVYITEEKSMGETDAYRAKGKPGTLRGWRVLLIGQDKAENPREIGDDALSFFRIVLKDGTKLNDIIATAKREMLWDMEHNPHSTWDERMSWDWEQQFRWAMNVVLYATWHEPGEHWIANKEARQLWERIGKLPAKSKKRKALSGKLQTLQQQRRIKLGASIVIQRGKSGSDGENSGARESVEPAYNLRIKTRVSGHWKRVVHGKGRALRRLQWIEPHWRNLDGLTPVQEPSHELR